MKKGIYCTVLAVVLTAAVFLLPIINHGPATAENDTSDVGRSSYVIADDKKEESSAPEISVPKSDETVTFIIKASGECIADALSASSHKNLRDYILSDDSRETIDTIKKNQAIVKASIRRMIPEADLDNCLTYNTVFNGFTIRAPYSVLQKLLRIGGVENVYLVSGSSLTIKENEDSDNSSDVQSGSDAGKTDAAGPEDTDGSDRKTTEEGIPLSEMTASVKSDIGQEETKQIQDVLIAVIDDGFNTSHEAFSYSMHESKYLPILSKLKDRVTMIGADGLNGSSGNLAFVYDYAGLDTDTVNPDSDHGTGIASVIAGCSGTNEDDYSGIAPGAELALMKVCPDGMKTTSDDILLAAIDDAAKLSPDIINISMGESGLNTNASVFTPVFGKLSTAGIIVCAAAGNEGLLTDSGNFSSTLTDYGTVSYPSYLTSVISVGAFVGSTKLNRYFQFGSEKISFSDAFEKSADGFAGLKDMQYIYLPDADAATFADEQYNGFVVVIGEGAENAGNIISEAAANGVEGIIFTGKTDIEKTEDNIPVAVVPGSSTEFFAKSRTGAMTYDGYRAERSPDALAPTDFTSYGTSPDLTLKPDILACGTDVAAASGGGYACIDGTSVSSAELAGAAAEILRNQPMISGSAQRKSMLLRSVLMNNAELIKHNSQYISPRLQGAGRLDISASEKAESILCSKGSPSVSMGPDTDGTFSFDLSLENLSNKKKEFTLSSALTKDRLYQDGSIFLNTLEPESINKYASVVFTVDGKETTSVRLEASEIRNIKVKISLTDDFVESTISKAENGFYIDGYIFATDTTGAKLHIPLTGFVGDLSSAEMFDSTLYDSSAPVLGDGVLYATAQSGNTYPSYPLGHNMTSDTYNIYNICIGKDTVKNYTDNPSAGTSFIIPNLFLLRNALDYTVSITDKKGTELYNENIGSASPFTNKESEPYMELLGRFNSDGLKNLFAKLPEGKYTVSISARPVASDSLLYNSVSYDFRLDNTSPTSLISKTYLKEGRLYLDLHAADLGGVQGFKLYTATFDGKNYNYADDLDSLIEQNYISSDCIELVNASADETTADYTYDITGLYHQLSRLSGFTSTEAPIHPIPEMIIFRAVDYAYNISEAASASTLSESTIRVKLVDDNDKEVKGAVISNGITTAESGENGKAVFEGVSPGLYAINILSLPEGCSTDYTVQVVNVTETDPEAELCISVKREFYIEEEISEPESSAPIQSKVDKYIPSVGNPAVPIVFVSLLLAVCSVSLIISKIKRK